MLKKMAIALLILWTCNGFAQNAGEYFPSKDLTTVGAYYYPEHWDEAHWDRDLKKMAENVIMV